MMTLEEKQNTTAESKKYALVKGDFSSGEANEIVRSLYAAKINFHELKSLSHYVRFGKKDDNSQTIIGEMRAAEKEAIELINKAKEKGNSVRINSTILIEIL